MTDELLNELQSLGEAIGHAVSRDGDMWRVSPIGKGSPRYTFFASTDAEEVRDYLDWRSRSQWWWLNIDDEDIRVEHPSGRGSTITALITDLAGPEPMTVSVTGGVGGDATTGEIMHVFVREGRVPTVGRWYK